MMMMMNDDDDDNDDELWMLYVIRSGANGLAQTMVLQDVTKLV